MTPKLTDEQRQALCHSDGPVAVEDDQTHRVYFLMDEPTLTNLRTQQSDLAAIREGIADLEAGRVAPLNELMTRIRMNLGIS